MATRTINGRMMNINRPKIAVNPRVNPLQQRPLPSSMPAPGPMAPQPQPGTMTGGTLQDTRNAFLQGATNGGPVSGSLPGNTFNQPQPGQPPFNMAPQQDIGFNSGSVNGFINPYQNSPVNTLPMQDSMQIPQQANDTVNAPVQGQPANAQMLPGGINRNSTKGLAMRRAARDQRNARGY